MDLKSFRIALLYSLTVAGDKIDLRLSTYSIYASRSVISVYYKSITVTPEGVENWTKPSDKSTSYSKGDRVFHNDVVWESTANNNMDEPGASDTWKEVNN